MKGLVYIASQYTIGDHFINVQRQIECGNKLMDLSFIPIAPLVNSAFYNMQKERTWAVWMDIDYVLISKCDYLLRLDGESRGADLEVAFAKQHNIPVFYSIDELYEFWMSKN